MSAQIMSQISVSVILLQSILLFLSFKKTWIQTLSKIASAIVLLSIFITFVVLVAKECSISNKYTVLFFKTLMLYCILRRFDVEYNVFYMTVSIVVAGLYCAYADLNYIYSCDISRRSIMLSFCTSSIAYCYLMHRSNSSAKLVKPAYKL